MTYIKKFNNFIKESNQFETTLRDVKDIFQDYIDDYNFEEIKLAEDIDGDEGVYIQYSKYTGFKV